MEEEMGMAFLIILLLFIVKPCSGIPNTNIDGAGKKSKIIEVKSGPEDVVWAVQLSDLHFSVHHPERAIEFRNFVGPALSMINPSLVFITGDLTDGKSKDLLTMRQDEKEWIEYQNVMDDVVKKSGLDKNIFYDLRGNHDNFGVPAVNGSYDFFSRYSLSGQLGRSGPVNSVTVQTRTQNLLFVGLDTTMSVGVRGPTNVFGHPTDQLLNEIDLALSQWDSQSAIPVTKVSFGHFTLSFSAASASGKTLKDVFLKHSLSAYLCGHLHSRFGKNLKRYHESTHFGLLSQKYLQLNIHQTPAESVQSCSNRVSPIEEFWEWEMGDWRKSRAVRILAIDKGYVSFIDTDFNSGARKTIILPTFPLDSRFMSSIWSLRKYKCQSEDPSSFATVRALVFSASPIVSVVVRIYDSKPGNLVLVMDSPMTKHSSASSRGDLYTVPWNFKAFEDSSSDRFWLQIEATDFKGESTLSELRPFSMNGLHAKLSWTWREFLVMGCQWAAFYMPILWLFYLVIFSILLIPKAIITFSSKRYTYKNFSMNKGFINGVTWVFTEVNRVPLAWWCLLVYLFYLILCPWLAGKVFTDGGERGYMTYKGWVVESNKMGRTEFLGFPDIFVIVLPHLFFVVAPSFLVIGVLAAERGLYREYLLSCSGKKKDDYGVYNEGSSLPDHVTNGRSNSYLDKRWIRKICFVVSLAILWKHFKNTRVLVTAYEANPVIHLPLYSMAIPVLLAYTYYKTRSP